MTVEVFVGHEYTPPGCELVFEVQELRDDVWVTVDRRSVTEGSSALKRVLWLNRRLVITEVKSEES